MNYKSVFPKIEKSINCENFPIQAYRLQFLVFNFPGTKNFTNSLFSLLLNEQGFLGNFL